MWKKYGVLERKGYAAFGLGVVIVAQPTLNPVRGANLVARDVSALFPGARIGLLLRKGSYQSSAQQLFIKYLQDFPTARE